MKSSELQNLGLNKAAIALAQSLCSTLAESGLDRRAIREFVRGVVAGPAKYAEHPLAGELARYLRDGPAIAPSAKLRTENPAPHRIWGSGLEDEAVAQLRRSCQLPISAAAALMPDAHVGYGLPIGGVLATRNAVIPYAVGVDIACRMKLSIIDIPAIALNHQHQRDRLIKAIETETNFGIGGHFDTPRQHDVLDADWGVSPITQQLKRKAQSQLGTSGSGNHFVEWGIVTVFDSPRDAASPDDAPPTSAPRGEPPHACIDAGTYQTHGQSSFGSGWSFDLPPGEYLALLSHSGSRGTGAAVCDHYSRLAMELHPDLPTELRHLAWLDMNSHAGQEYWHAMNLMGQYASANHACIHDHIIKHLGARRLAMVENHHNFAWLETHDVGEGPEQLIVHRKGATPAEKGVLGMIPGSMATPGYIVVGRGSTPSLQSASHGAGRVMSRTKARDTFRWGSVRKHLDDQGIQVLSAGIDESPGVYKDIRTVMAAQADLVSLLARFDPKIVKMAPEGERAED